MLFTRDRAEISLVMAHTIVMGSESLEFHQGQCQCITDRLHDRNTGARRNLQRAGLDDIAAHVENQFAEIAQGRVNMGGNTDNSADTQLTGIFQHFNHLNRFAAGGEGNNGVLRIDHTQITMSGFRWMNKKCGCAGLGQGRREFVRDVARLANAGCDDLPGAGKQQVDGFFEVVGDIDVADRLCFFLNNEGHARFDVHRFASTG